MRKSQPKRQPRERTSAQISISVDPETKEWLRQAAAKDLRTVSKFIEKRMIELREEDERAEIAQRGLRQLAPPDCDDERKLGNS